MTTREAREAMLQDMLDQLEGRFGVTGIRASTIIDEVDAEFATFRNMWRTIREVYDYPQARIWVQRRNAGMAMDRPIDNIERGIELAEMLALEDQRWHGGQPLGEQA